MKSTLERKFLMIWQALAGPPIIPEYRFYATRKWRFDYALPAKKIAIELEGGIWIQGAHSRGAHFNSDAEKYNTAMMDGWRPFRFTTDMITVPVIDPFIVWLKDQPNL